MKSVSFTIYGDPASKSNSRRFVMIKGKPRWIKSAKALAYEKSFLLQSRIQDKIMFPEGVAVVLACVVYYADAKSDLDISLIQDCLEKARIYKNDRQVQRIAAEKRFDKLRPRAEITVSPMVEVGE